MASHFVYTIPVSRRVQNSTSQEATPPSTKPWWPRTGTTARTPTARSKLIKTTTNISSSITIYTNDRARDAGQRHVAANDGHANVISTIQNVVNTISITEGNKAKIRVSQTAARLGPAQSG